MANWYYYTADREKIGPIRGKELKQLALQGTITPETFVEDENGRTALAKNVTGLTFPNAPTSVNTQNSQPNYFYFDENGYKYGPVSEQQIQSMAEQGIITPNTTLETDGGYTGLAGQIPGLFVAVPAQPDPLPVSPPAPSVKERVEVAAKKTMEWGKETYQKAPPHVSTTVEKIFARATTTGTASKASTTSGFDQLFDTNFTRFLYVPFTKIFWKLLIFLHFLAFFLAIGGGAWIGIRTVKEARKEYTEARAQYAADRESERVRHAGAMERYRKEMETYREFEQWQAMDVQQRREERQRMSQNNERERLSRWNAWERWGMQKPVEPTLPTPPERPRYTGPTWEIIVYPIVFVPILLLGVTLSLLYFRLMMEMGIILFRNEANTRVAKDHYLRIEKMQKYDMEQYDSDE